MCSQSHLAIAKAHLLAATEGIRSCNCWLQALAETKILKAIPLMAVSESLDWNLERTMVPASTSRMVYKFTSFSGWLELTTWKSKLMSWIEKIWTSLNSSIFSLLLTFASRHSEPTKSSPEFVANASPRHPTRPLHFCCPRYPETWDQRCESRLQKHHVWQSTSFPHEEKGLNEDVRRWYIFHWTLTHEGTFKNGLKCAHVSCSSLICHLLQSIFWAVFPSLWTDLLKRSPGLWTTGHT